MGDLRVTTMKSSIGIVVSRDDLALILYYPDSVDYGEISKSGSFPNARCKACDSPAGAHYCAPREAARNKLWNLLEKNNNA